MKFTKVEIKQLTPDYIERLNKEQLANLCKGVVADLVEAHDRLNTNRSCECKSCNASLDANATLTATGGHYVIDIVLPKNGEIGLQGTYTKHLYGKSLCSCGFETHLLQHCTPSDDEWSVTLSGLVHSEHKKSATYL